MSDNLALPNRHFLRISFDDVVTLVALTVATPSHATLNACAAGKKQCVAMKDGGTAESTMIDFYICDDHSIADIACWPWILTHKRQEIALDEFANVRRWHETMKSRSGLRRGHDGGKELFSGTVAR